MIADYILTIFLTLLISGGVVAVLFPSIVRFATKNNFYDLPDDRHIHVGKVPRLGGVPFMPAMIMAIFVAFVTNSTFSPALDADEFFLPMKQLLVAGIGALIMYLTGLADDLSGVRYRYKFITQTTSAALMCASGVWIDNLHGFFGIYDIPMWLGVPLTIMLVMLIVNSVNLIDGIDGLASGLCIIGISAFAALFAYCGYYRFLIVAIAAIVVAYKLYQNYVNQATIRSEQAEKSLKRLTQAYNDAAAAVNNLKDAMEEYVRKSGGKIIANKGATFYAVSASVCQLVSKLVAASESMATVSTMMHGEYGIDDVCLSVLSLVGPKGHQGNVLVDLTEEEIAKLKHSADTLKGIIAQVEI